MNKTELITAVAKTTELTKKDVAKAIDALTTVIKKELKKGNKITLMGFGSWEVRKRKARTGRNPQTGAKIKIKAKKVPKFNPGKDLKEAVS
ncbi:HU family DNA-binding protein [bacterium]|nr:HU family DNA-binding protein [bacterium]